MMVRGIRWVGVSTRRVADMRALATHVLGMRIDRQSSANLFELTTADGSKLERFGSRDAADKPRAAVRS